MEKLEPLADGTALAFDSAVLVLGRGPSMIESVRLAECDWSLRAYAGPGLTARIDAECERGGDVWLVAVDLDDDEYSMLDRDSAVINYGPAWRPVYGSNHASP